MQPLALSILLLTSSIAPAGTTYVAAQATDSARQDALDDFLRRVEDAQRELVQGKPSAFQALWSQSADITLSGGLGGAVEKGADAVRKRLDWVGSQYVDGTRTHQEIARGVGADLAYIVQKETIRFRPSAGAPYQVQELRTTMVFRREKDGWKIVHRHADAQNAKAPNNKR